MAPPDQAEAHAVFRSWRKPRNSLRLASCMRRADSVLLCAFAIWVQALKADSGLEVALAWRRGPLQGSQRFPRGGVAFVGECLLAPRVHDPIGLPARTMKVQVRVEGGLVERMDVFGVLGGDVAVAYVFANYGSVFRSTSPLSLLLRARDLVCTIRRSRNNPETVSLMNSEPLSE